MICVQFHSQSVKRIGPPRESRLLGRRGTRRGDYRGAEACKPAARIALPNAGDTFTCRTDYGRGDIATGGAATCILSVSNGD